MKKFTTTVNIRISGSEGNYMTITNSTKEDEYSANVKYILRVWESGEQIIEMPFTALNKAVKHAEDTITHIENKD